MAHGGKLRALLQAEVLARLQLDIAPRPACGLLRWQQEGAAWRGEKWGEANCWADGVFLYSWCYWAFGAVPEAGFAGTAWRHWGVPEEGRSSRRAQSCPGEEMWHGLGAVKEH